jgi:hypothetical protein
VYVKDVQHWCDKPSCPICFKHGWAVREAGEIEDRLFEASCGYVDPKGVKHVGLGQVEHLSISVPQSWYGLSVEELRERVKKALVRRGVSGAVMIFHGFRYASAQESREKGVPFGWYWSVHFHVLGFVAGGYGRCRHCPKMERKGSNVYCGDWSCSGFEARTRLERKKDGCLVKVMEERAKISEKYREKCKFPYNVFGTAWYQLNHATLVKGVRRFHVATWFGVVSYRKLKITVEKRTALCPICQHELVDIRYSGAKKFVWDRDSPEYKHERLEDFEEDGRVVWSEVVKSSRWE